MNKTLGMAGPRRAGALLVAALLAGLPLGCTDEGEAALSTGPCAGSDAPAGPRALVACADDSVGYVTNPLGTGTGLVVDVEGEPHVLTNLHVVDPYDSADVTFAGGTITGLPVRWVDASTDLALLGPVPDGEDVVPVPLVDVEGDLRGEQAFLVGFPGDAGGTRSTKPEDLEATISAGIVSRHRHLAEFGLRFIQTDATIAGGQSGGPLFDARGRVLGIAGLAFADTFGLALSVGDVKESIARMVEDGGDEYLALPLEADASGDTGGRVDLTDGTDVQRLYLGRSQRARDLQFRVANPAEVVVRIISLLHDEILATSANAPQLYGQLAGSVGGSGGFGQPDADAGGLPPDDAPVDDSDSKAEVRPGSFELSVAAGDLLLIEVERPLADRPASVDWASNLPLTRASAPREVLQAGVGDVIDRVLHPYRTAFDVLVDLAPGSQVEMFARSAIGDMSFTVFPPGTTPDAGTLMDPDAGLTTVDDSDSGLFGTDARQRFDVATGGTYRIRVQSYDNLTELVRFSVTDCGLGRCDSGSEVGTLG